MRRCGGARTARCAAGIAAALLLAAAVPGSAAAQTGCSVRDHRPCARSFCSVFDGAPCVPDLPHPFGEGLRFTVELREPAPRPRVPPIGPANTLRELFDAMSTC